MNDEKNKSEYEKELIDYSRHLFDRYASDFDILDNKALGVIGIAGLLIGFQALNIDTIAENIQCFENGFDWFPFLSLLALVFHSFFLILCIFRGLKAFQIREFEYPGDVKEIKVGANKEVLLNNIVDTYQKATVSIEKINKQKAEALHKSVKSITKAIIFLIAFIFLMVIIKCSY